MNVVVNVNPWSNRNLQVTVIRNPEPGLGNWVTVELANPTIARKISGNWERYVVNVNENVVNERKRERKGKGTGTGAGQPGNWGNNPNWANQPTRVTKVCNWGL